MEKRDEKLISSCASTELASCFHILAAFIKKDVKAVDGFAISQRSASAGIIIYFSSPFVGSVVGAQTRIFASTRDDATCPPLPSIPRLRLCIVRIHSHYSFFSVKGSSQRRSVVCLLYAKEFKTFLFTPFLLFCPQLRYSLHAPNNSNE